MRDILPASAGGTGRIVTLTRNEVVLAYRLLLGREPESEAVVESHLGRHDDLGSLRRDFVASPEFRGQFTPAAAAVAPLAATLPLGAPPLHVETDAGPEALARLLRAVAARWEAIGEAAPHWSVLSSEEFRPDRIAETEEAFYASGAGDLAILLGILARIGRAPTDFATLVEYGCGVGRLTMELAPAFRQVVGLDISPTHLRLAEQRRQRLGFGNIAFHQVTADRLHPVQGFDLWFSRIVLQHNPPPVILHILDGMFRALAPGGLAVFQVPTYYEGYRFSLAEYAADASASAVEMHMVPQRAVLDLACQHGCRLLDLREDTWVVAQRADCLSNNFVFEKG